jgi:Mn2+/Fe2+ NRAMP family transporter
LLLPLVTVLFVANVINIAADLGAMAEAAAMIVGGPRLAYAIGLGIASLALQVLVPYDRYVRYLKWLSFVLVAYIVVAACIDVPWTQALQATFVPSIAWDGKAVTVIVAVLGTTISPYLFFWQASQEVEEQHNDRRDEPLKSALAQAPRQLAGVQFDTLVGMAVSNLIAFFIMLTAAVTLYAHGIRDIDSAAQAAKALEPVAGKFASVVFAAGIVGTGLLALPVLAGSCGYALADTFGWPASLQKRAHAAPRFYAVIGLAMFIGIALNFFTFNAMKALYWSAVLNGFVAVPVLIAMTIAAANHTIMGPMAIKGALRALGWFTVAVILLSTIGAIFG